MIPPLEGGCLCGAIRYRVSTPPLQAGYCHCRLCQRSTGAPVLPWASVPLDGFAYTRGTPVDYRSSAWGMRQFCGGCGAQILYRDAGSPTEISINLTTLDDPAAIVPDHHIWTSSRIRWFEVADDLPRYAEQGPASANQPKETGLGE